MPGKQLSPPHRGGLPYETVLLNAGLPAVPCVGRSKVEDG